MTNQTSGFEQTALDVVKNSLMDILPGGIMGINLEKHEVLFASDGMFTLAGYEHSDFTTRDSHFWYKKLVHPDDSAALKQSIKKQLSEKGMAEISYRLLKKDGTAIWVKQYSGILDSPEYGSYFIGLVLDYSETKTAYQNAEKTRAEMETLINTIPGGVAKLSLDDGFRIIFASDGYYKMTGYTREECNAPPMNGCAIDFLVPEDIPIVKAGVKKLIQTNQPTCVEYRIRKKDGSIAWNMVFCSKAEYLGCHPVIDAVFTDITAAKTTERSLISLINTIPGGVAQFYVEDDVYVNYGNHFFYQITGYTQEEFNGGEIQAKYLTVVHPEDRANLLKKVTSFIHSEKRCPSLDYRIITKSGEIKWMRASASRVDNGLKKENSAQCVITDITEEKATAKQAVLNEERYRIIAEQTQDIVFDLDIESGCLHHSPVFKMKFGYAIPENYPFEEMLTTDTIYEKDKPAVSSALRTLLTGAPYVETEYRIKHISGKYIWCRNRMSTIFDEAGKPSQVVGIITDIDAYKKETAALKEKARKDSLTKLLNRMAMQEQVQKLIDDEIPGKKGVFYLIDIDNFKWINDTLGHAAGDTALIEISERIHKELRKNEMAGRLGGDEFAVYVDDISSMEEMYVHAEKLHQIFRHMFSFADKKQSLSCSIGISVFPDHGTTFDDLYRRADIALYDAKENGKNRTILYTVGQDVK